MNSGSQNWGWRLFAGGALLGALGGMSLIPHAWSTAAAQVGVALGHPPEWIRAAYIGFPDSRNGSAPAIERALAEAPDNATLHLGAAALGYDTASLGASQESSPSAVASESEKVPARLEALGRRFPFDPAV